MKRGIQYGKKGVSPLLVTVILVVLVIAVVVIVTLWGKGVQKDIQSKQGGIALAKLSCTGVTFNVIDTSSGSVTVENNGPDISGVVLVVDGDGNVQSQLYDQPIETGGSRSFPYSGIPGVPNVEKVSVIPTVGQGVNRPCTDQKKEVEF